MFWPDDYIDKILCGDCLEVMEDIPDQSIDMILADLPYGVTSRNEWDKVIPMLLLWEQYYRVIKNNGVIVLTSRQPFTTDLIVSGRNHFKYTMIWKKNLKSGNLNARKRPMVGFEDISVYYKNQPTYNPQRIRRTTQRPSGNKHNSKSLCYGEQKSEYLDRQSEWLMPDDVIEIKCVHNSSGKLLPTQKPVELFEYLIRTYTNSGYLVLDNVIGSGTTAEACINTGRHFIGIDILEKHCQISRNRISGLREIT